ncbi:hypothetical protein quinque_013123 [Culex quinquefasciatus]
MSSSSSNGFPRQITPSIPIRRQDVIRWDGWGYKDSRFELVGREDSLRFSGKRYPIAGGAWLNGFKTWVEEYFGVKASERAPEARMPVEFPDPVRSEGFLRGLEDRGVRHSEDGMDRLMRSHGQTLEDIERVRGSSYAKIPDVVVWPSGHDQVVEVVRLAQEFEVAIIPVGGNSSVSEAVTTPNIVGRTIVSLDMTQMNRLLWLNVDNMTACFEAGVTGQDIERELAKEGLTLGHEPDSYEFSTLGGWIATRASGMKKNTYGNIEDLVVRIKMVTGVGVLEKQILAPRVSCGPDLNHVIFGSEGTLGVITEAVIKVRSLPEVRRYGSLVFRDFETGVGFLREIAAKRLQPASIRLMDNMQFQLGQHLQPDGTWFNNIVKSVAKTYLSTIRRFKLDSVAVVTLMFEGTSEEVKAHEKKIYEVASTHGAINGGSKGGEKGYTMTFVIAYIRDFAMEFNIMAESFETSLPWDKCLTLCRNVKSRVTEDCHQRGITRLMIACRVTQVYDDGCCVYFYLAYKHPDHLGDTNPVQLFKAVEDRARDEILASGGTLSHHHGVGKVRSRWYSQSVSTTGVTVLQAVKRALDPKNTFAAGNLVGEEPKCKM